MIFGNNTQEKTYAFLPEDLKECFAYAKEHDLASYEKGSHPIDGERLFVNVVEYETTRPENRFWEAHRNYLDVHLMLDGQEQIDLNFIENMESMWRRMTSFPWTAHPTAMWCSGRGIS